MYSFKYCCPVLECHKSVLLLCHLPPDYTVAATAAGQQLYHVADLPRRPKLACDTPAVLTALMKCSYQGASGPSCCSALDAIFANRTSPAFG